MVVGMALAPSRHFLSFGLSGRPLRTTACVSRFELACEMDDAWPWKERSGGERMFRGRRVLIESVWQEDENVDSGVPIVPLERSTVMSREPLRDG